MDQGGDLRRFKAGLFKAMAHPVRVHLLELLQEGEKSVGELQAAVGEEAGSVSQHLAVLRLSNLVDTRKAGTAIYYRLGDPQVSSLLDTARAIFETHLRRLQAAARS